jgi:hypothetical protein
LARRAAQVRPQPEKSVCRELIERQHRYGSYERIDDTVESSGSFKFRTKA